MRVFLGPFHPDLEKTFVREILAEKQSDLLCPLLVLIPSDSLRRRIKFLLARERGLSLLNLQLLTFHQLSLRLCSEARPGYRPDLCDDLFLEEVLRQMIRARRPGTEAFVGIEERVGGCAALWQTLRDLKDGLVEPPRALEALREGHFGRDLSARIINLLTLFQAFLSFCETRGIADYSDLDRTATERAAASGFLKQFRRIFYYGFYDLTQVQLDLFHAIARSYPTTLFFPLWHAAPQRPGWVFAERFYQRYLRGLAEAAPRSNPAEGSGSLAFRLFDETPTAPDRPLPGNWRCTILSSFGARDEVTAVAKEILRLMSEEGLAPEEIGVVARNLDGYASKIKEIFCAHRISFTGSVEEPLVQFPIAKAVLLLLNLPAKDYLRNHVIDLLASPYFSAAPAAGEGPVRPDLWDLLTRQLGITKGPEAWRRLQKYAGRDLVVSNSSGEDASQVIRIAAPQIRRLSNLFEALYRDLEALPKEARWSRYAESWKLLLAKYLGITADEGRGVDSQEQRCRERILDILDKLAQLDRIEGAVSLSYFSQTYEQWLERCRVPATDNLQGVAVLNAMAARGLSFRALFVVGLNEGIFPRTIREDAFLRDREREIFEQDLGYKVPQKLAAFDEEKLIFTLLANAARERLYCLFQRSDETGRALPASWYLEELRRAVGSRADTQLREITIPRGLAEKANVEPFRHNDLMLPEEMAVRLSLQGKDPSALIEACSLAPEIYRQGRRAVERLELGSARLGELDGMVGPLADYWNRFVNRGFSPTALETYGRCPFQYFARHVLGLERLDRPEDVVGLGAADYGELGHRILKSFYQELLERNYFDNRRGVDIAELLQTVAQRAFAEYESTNPVGHAIAWESQKETLAELLLEAILQDLDELCRSEFRPIALEADVTGKLGEDWPEPLAGLTIRGRLDRIDRHPAENLVRVIDYKFKLSGRRTAEDSDLERSALRAERLQPPLYSILGSHFANTKDKKAPSAVEAFFYFLAPRWSEGPLCTAAFSAAAWAGKLGREIKLVLARLVQEIRGGHFFMQPGDSCRRCEVSEICRRNHPPSAWRAENDPATRWHRELRDKSLKDL